VLSQVAQAGDIPDPFDHRNRWRKTIRDWPCDPARQLEDAEFWEVFEGCVQKLPPLLAEVFRLREMLRMDVAEVCDVTGISRQNLAVRLHRARLALRGCLEERWFGEDKHRVPSG
jgi:RNA polymerase sigma-70 factor (ECF subfamily)